MRHRLVLATLLLSAAVPAVAQDTPSPQPAPASQAATPVSEKADVDRYCLRETGTRIRAHATRANGRRGCPSMRSGRVYTQEDLRATGEISIAEALRRLDTSVY